jgi:L-fuculose-phosphate aldolase
MFLNQFQNVGRALFNRGLVSSASGNLSIRMGDHLIITRRGSNMGALQEKDLIETGINKNDRNTPLASVELPVHRAIYQNTNARAIVHAHPTHTIALSLAVRMIDSDHLKEFCGMQPVPVVGWGLAVKEGGIPDIIAGQLTDNRVVVVHGHGSFAIGQLLEEAYNLTTGLEEACEIICLTRAMGTVNLTRE